MPTRWNVPRHEVILARLEAALDATATTPGVVVLGPDGCGKSTLARLAAERHAGKRPGTLTRWVTGTPAQRMIPFGAFSHLVEVDEMHTPAAALLRAARVGLVRTGQDQNPLLIVDDAHQLDTLSATLVYQLALAGDTRMIVTARSDLAPRAIAALWGDALLDRLDVPASEPADDIAGKAAALLDELPRPARTVLDYLAVDEPLALVDLAALIGNDAVRQAAEFGAAEIRMRGGNGPDPVVYTAHPQFVERARAQLADDDARTLRTELVTVLSGRLTRNPSDRLHLAALATESSTPRPVDEVVDAAEQALRLGGLELGERLARAALKRSGNLTARIALAQALAWAGRGHDADDVLAQVDPAALREPQLIDWALPRAANQFFVLGEPTKAMAFLQTTRERITAPRPRATLDGLMATFAMNAGTPLRALRIADEVLSSPHADSTAVGWAAAAAALSSARVGALDAVDTLAARALAAEHPGLLRFTSGFGRVLKLLLIGQPIEARSVAQRHTDFAELQQPGRAIGEVLVAYVAIAQGDFAVAVPLLRNAVDTLLPTGYSWGPLALMLLAQALGQQGELIDSAKALSQAEARHGLKSALFTPELALAKTWTKAARGDRSGAIEAARAAVQAAERGGQSAVALRALQDAARLGDTQAVYRAQRLAVEVNCTLGRLTVAHARAVATADAEALRDVAAELADAGFHPAAADAATAAQRCG